MGVAYAGTAPSSSPCQLQGERRVGGSATRSIRSVVPVDAHADERVVVETRDSKDGLSEEGYYSEKGLVDAGLDPAAYNSKFGGMVNRELTAI